jgi:hypothetical protein
VEGADGAQPEEGSEENFYAATRAQAAQLAYRALRAEQAAVGEAVITGEQPPLAYREAVKQYSLTQHRREH